MDAAHTQVQSAKPPSSDNTIKVEPRQKSSKADDGVEAANIQNDLALQRLLKESHLLEKPTDVGPAGRNRLKALEMRMQSIGGKAALMDQKSMPMSHRKGIAAKAARAEGLRRQEARENGIVLERPSSQKSRGSQEKRTRGIAGPTVGRLRGGTLSLSKEDVASIQGRGGGSQRGKRGTRGSGRAGRRR